MRILVAANSNPLLHYLAGKYPGSVGWMVSPATKFFEPREWLPYAIDNGKYAAYSSQVEWDEDAFFDLLDRYKFCRYAPEWIVVPDEVANREQTLWNWVQYERRLRMYKWRLAFVVQDGMTTNDVPKSADVVFVGGTTNWKWRNVGLFCATFPRVHVGRVNSGDKLEYCLREGVESVDGSGWFREGDGQKSSRRRAPVNQLVDFVSGERRETTMALL